MKRSWYLYIAIVVLGFNLLSTKAQFIFEQIRNSDTIVYYVNSPYGNNAEFTWTITGGTIIGHSSPYTADGADTIKVIWNDSNKTSANYGSLRVYEVVNWTSGSSCSSDEEQINVESWVQPKASTDTSGIIICSGESFVIKVDFEGKPEYRYKWKLYDKDNPAIVIEDHTAGFINSINTSTDIVIAGIENSGSAEKLYEFEITDVQDGLPDDMPGNVSLARLTIYVQPKTSAGTLESNEQLIRR